MTALQKQGGEIEKVTDQWIVRRPELAEEEMEIDLIELFYVLMNHWVKLLIVIILGAALGGGYAYKFIAPTYKSTAKMYIVSASSDSVVNLQDLNIGTNLTHDYVELMLSYPVLDLIIDELDLEMTSAELKGMISITNPANTRILEVTATTTDPEFSRILADTMVEVAVEYLPKTMSTEQPNVAQYAKVAERKAGPSYVKYALIGGILFFILLAGYYIMSFLMDDTLHDSDDVEKCFGFVPLTTIPDTALITGKSAFGQLDFGKKGKPGKRALKKKKKGGK